MKAVQKRESFNMSKALRIVSAAAVLAAVAAGQALAHAHLKDSIPADKASVATPAELDLIFTEELNLRFSGVKVTGPDKNNVKLGDAKLSGDEKTLSVPVSGRLGAGQYAVEWHVLSTDGHKTNGSFTFTVKP